MAEREEISIVCRFGFQLFQNDSFRVCRYEYIEKPQNVSRCDFIAKGNDIPTTKDVDITLFGQWVTKGKDRSFAVSSFQVPLPSSEAGVVAYLSSLRCKIGKARARALYKTFGENLWFIIENQPERLMEANLSMSVIDKLLVRLKETQIQAKIMEMFRGTHMTFHKANKLMEKYGLDTLNVLRDRPYAVCEIEGFSFATVDAFAISRGVDPTNLGRRKAAVTAALDSAATEGHVCLPREELIGRMMRLLNAKYPNAISETMCDAAIVNAIADRTIVCTAGFIYTANRAMQEKWIVAELFRLMAYSGETFPDGLLDEIIARYEQENQLSLADSQKQAVKCAMNHPVVVLTGGPGTGKTTTTKAILYCHKALFEKDSCPLLLSPTGKAARRMSESTGYPAQTIHSGLGLGVNNECRKENEEKPDELCGNLILVDESSMADQYITYELVRRVRTGSKLIFIGDPDQLPSVGCGNVLFELIRSKEIPVVKLSVVFRQAQDNPIVENAVRIMQGRTDLLYNGKSFSIMNLNRTDLIFNRAVNMYVKSVQKYGIDSTVLLCPYRKSTDLNVNSFNLAIQSILNPPKRNALTMAGKSVFAAGNKSVPVEFRKGDKVMMTVNTPVAKNGDTGYIREIVHELDPNDNTRYVNVAKVEFNDDGEIHSFNAEQIRDLDLAYCTTVHKSQGSEYPTVIMVVSSLHCQMLKRNLFYTGITRAKQNVLLIGETSAVASAILDVDMTRRYTLLADRIHAEAVRRKKTGN